MADVKHALLEGGCLFLDDEERQVMARALSYARMNYTDFAHVEYRSDPDDIEDKERVLDSLIDRVGE